MAKVFVTGATGQIGSHIVKYLVRYKPLGIKRPEDIRCLVRGHNKVPMRKKQGITKNTHAPIISTTSFEHESFLDKLGVEIFKGDLNNKELLISALNGIDYIFHLAANVYVYSNYKEMYKTNVVGTKNLLDAFISSSAVLFIHTSSTIVYDTSVKTLKKCLSSGKESMFDFRESCPWGPIKKNRDVPYAVTKRLGEKLVADYSKKNPDKLFIITRLGPVVGPKDRQMIPALIASMRTHLPKLVDGGKTKISLTAPEDVARAQLFLAEHVLNSKIKSGEVFNIAHEMVSFKELFLYLAEYYSCDPPTSSIPRWLFKSIKPLLKLTKRFVPNNIFLQTFFSSSTLEYLEKSYSYNSEKLKALGFNYKVSIRDSFFKGLRDLDPDKKLLG